MNRWFELLNSAGWQSLERIWAEDRKNLVDALMANARMSSDPQVRGLAAKIDAIDKMLDLPKSEAEAAGNED